MLFHCDIFDFKVLIVGCLLVSIIVEQLPRHFYQIVKRFLRDSDILNSLVFLATQILQRLFLRFHRNRNFSVIYLSYCYQCLVFN